MLHKRRAAILEALRVSMDSPNASYSALNLPSDVDGLLALRIMVPEVLSTFLVSGRSLDPKVRHAILTVVHEIPSPPEALDEPACVRDYAACKLLGTFGFRGIASEGGEPTPVSMTEKGIDAFASQMESYRHLAFTGNSNLQIVNHAIAYPQEVAQAVCLRLLHVAPLRAARLLPWLFVARLSPSLASFADSSINAVAIRSGPNAEIALILSWCRALREQRVN